MDEALLFDKLENKRIRCNICQWHCVINPGKVGICRVRRNENGEARILNYAKVSSVAADPIEKKPLFHFFPGSDVLSFGTIGCNFHCEHCQNWTIACVQDPEDWDMALQDISPQEAVNMALRQKCSGLAWTYNEPTIWFEYTLDSAKLAKEKSLYTVYVTNGFISPEALDMLGPYLDAFRVDVKAYTDEAYARLTKVRNWRGILKMAERARHHWNMHVEVVTNIVPQLNDDDEQLKGIASWIKNSLGELTPWHVTRFYPHYHMQHIPPTPLKTLEKAYAIGRNEGLRFVYTGNVPGQLHEDTICYNCGRTVIKRTGYTTSIISLNGSRCANCGADLNIRITANREVAK